MSALRTFVALDVGPEARAGLAGWMAELGPRLPGFKWVEPENLHLTLRFLGETPAERLPALREALAAAAAEVAPFELVVRGAGAFPDAGAPRVLWAGVEATAALAALQRRVEEAVRGLGWEPEGTPFRPHVTLARARHPRPRADATAALAAAGTRVWGRMAVREVVLQRSTLTPAGPVYDPLGRFPLGRELR